MVSWQFSFVRSIGGSLLVDWIFSILHQFRIEDLVESLFYFLSLSDFFVHFISI